MGTPKALVELAGRPLIAYPLAALADAGIESVVVAKPDSPLPPLECAVVREPEQPLHPLTGVVAALDAADGRAVIALGCDMPLVPPPLLEWLAGLDETTAVIEVGGRVQPLLARYEPRAAAPLRAALARDESATAAVLGLNPRVVGEQELAKFGDPELLAFNVNTPEELDRATRLLHRDE
jgi:molybdopterin-guanine dinucleotide biosynthesis protein A